MMFESAAVIGLGLIGGSLARDLAERGVPVAAYDANPAHLRDAVSCGIVARTLDPSLAGVERVDVIIIATPVDAALDVLRCVASRSPRARLITDVGSTKARIVAAAQALGLADRFVGSHPMTGDHRSGWDAARAGLFSGARVYLTPVAESSPELVECARALWAMVGACPELIGVTEHDVRLAWTSHLPHIVSSAIARSLSNNHIQRDDLGPGGRDVTRLAGSSPEMWSAIATENAEAIDAALAATQREIASVRTLLASGDVAALRAWLGGARAWFDV